jgi:hypothetical protein
MTHRDTSPKFQNVVVLRIDQVVGAFISPKQPDSEQQESEAARKKDIVDAAPRIRNYIQVSPAPDSILVNVSVLYTRTPPMEQPNIMWLWSLASNPTNPTFTPIPLGRLFAGESPSFPLTLKPAVPLEADGKPGTATLSLQLVDINEPFDSGGKVLPPADALNMVIYAYDYWKIAKEHVEHDLGRLKR